MNFLSNIFVIIIIQKVFYVDLINGLYTNESNVYRNEKIFNEELRHDQIMKHIQDVVRKTIQREFNKTKANEHIKGDNDIIHGVKYDHEKDFNDKLKERKSMDDKSVGKYAGQQNKDKTTPIIFIVGPESSGNRFTVNLIKEAGGCFGKSGHNQPLDNEIKNGQKKDWSALNKRVLRSAIKWKCVVLHRSFPHNNNFVSLGKMAKDAREEGFSPQVIVLFRYMPAVIESQIKRKHVPNEHKAREFIHRAYLEIYDDIIMAKLPFTNVIYEKLGDPAYIKWIFNEIGVEYSKSKIPSFKNANGKHEHGRK